jgi:2-amino-4-hydroxy-6-hydroxymethyldihydropteridine diphosphokinase
MTAATPDAPSAEALGLPAWHITTPRRRSHIARVVALLDTWAKAMGLSPQEARAWHDAGAWHDALRDAPGDVLRPWVADPALPVPMMHGPAASARLAADGEARSDVLEAIAVHTTGRAAWGRTAQALYMADFLEPGRPFDTAQRAEWAARVPMAFNETLRDVVRARLVWGLREGKPLHPETVALWNAIR